MMHENFINALGGNAKVAKRLGIELTRVCNWCHRGVPWTYRPTLAKLAKRKRIPLPPNFLEPERRAP